MNRSMIAMLLVVASLSGCTKLTGDTVDCLNADGHSAILGVVKEQIEKAVINQAGADEDGANLLSKSKVRSTIQPIKMAIEDIRTSKEDPNSTKKFCVGTLKLTFPSEVLEDANKARELVEAEPISKLAEERDIERNANSFAFPIDFNVQPTDDGRKVFAEIEDGEDGYQFFAEIIASHLLRRKIEIAKIEEQEAIESQNRLREAALREQRAADLGEARAESQLAEQAINATWQAIDPIYRNRLLDLQRAWIRKKIADCKIEAASASIDLAERETSRLRCHSRMDQQRTAYLRQFLNSSDEY